jgi:NADPH:quinone reductase-like Zn-dependent oxidoreductase
VHGAAGGLGRLALQTLSAWGARPTAIAKASDLRGACLEAGAAEAVDRDQDPFASQPLGCAPPLVREVHRSQGAANVTVRNIVTSLRVIGIASDTESPIVSSASAARFLVSASMRART